MAALAAAVGAGTVVALNQNSQSAGSVSSQQIPSPGRNAGGANTTNLNEQSVANKVEPGVVDINSQLKYENGAAAGTGMVLSANGLVLTNNHVVDGSTSLHATLVSNGKTYQAQVLGVDPVDDVALIKLVGASGLKTVSVGDSAKVTLGTGVVAIGNAGGRGGPPTVTSGTVTALSRTITASDSGSGANSETLHNMLQTNAPIAAGDSGGPLANAAGQVVGMDTAANSQSLGGQAPTRASPSRSTARWPSPGRSRAARQARTSCSGRAASWASAWTRSATPSSAWPTAGPASTTRCRPSRAR